METNREGKYANNSLVVAKTKDLRVIPIHIHFLSFASCRNIGENNEVGSKRGLSDQNKMQASRIQANDRQHTVLYLRVAGDEFCTEGENLRGMQTFTFTHCGSLISFSLPLDTDTDIDISHTQRDRYSTHTFIILNIYTNMLIIYILISH